MESVQTPNHHQSDSIDIFHVISSTDIGGAEMMLEKFLTHHESSSASIVISLTTLGPVGKRLQTFGIPVFALNMRFGLGLATGIYNYLSLLKRYRPIYIVGWMYHANLLVSICNRIFPSTTISWNIRCGLSDYDTWSRKRKLVFACCRALSRHPKHIIYNSRKSMLQHAEKNFADASNSVIYNGFDPTRFTIDKDDNLRKKLGIPSDAFLIGCFGRNIAIKRMPDLLRVCEQLRRRDCPARILYIGRQFDTPEFMQEVSRSAADSWVHLVKQSDSLLPFYKILDLFCLCSQSEGFPNVVGEAAYSGVPIISTDVSDLKELFLQNWQVSPVGDIGSLAASAYRIYKMEQKDLNELVNSQRKSFQKKTDISQVANSLANLFLDM